jgi:hypothetical protein
VQIRYNLSIRSHRPASRRATLFGGAIGLVGVLVLLWINIGFARYAITGFFWTRTTGTVLAGPNSFAPAIQFATIDGAVHTFSEDYMSLCGNFHAFCVLRSFTPGQVVPIVYDPAEPSRAFIHDWALISSVITWFLELAVCLLAAIGIAVTLRRKPHKLSLAQTPVRSRGPFR